jgi:hypothetical protein
MLVIPIIEQWHEKVESVDNGKAYGSQRSSWAGREEPDEPRGLSSILRERGG